MNPLISYSKSYLKLSYFVYSFSFLFLWYTPASAQNDFYIILQADVTAFQAAGHTSISGDLIIGGDINDPDAVQSLNGLSSLTSIGGSLILEENMVCCDLTGLDNVLTIGGNLEVNGNTVLQNFTGLTSLQTITGDLIIGEFNNIQSLAGLNTLTTLGGINTTSNSGALLSDFTGLEGITSIGGDVILDNITGFNPLSFNGLNNLISIGGKLEIQNIGNMATFSGLDALTTIGGDLEITNNTTPNSLSEITAFQMLNSVGGDLIVTNNDYLTTCCGLYDIITNTGVSGTTTISNNGAGSGDCNSATEITTSCTSDCPSGEILFKTQTDIDNFIINYPNCEQYTGNIRVEEDGTPVITNLNGLANLSDIFGSLTIFINPSLNDISGLNTLSHVDALMLYDNPLVTNLDGLSSLSTVDDYFRIQNMAGLTSGLGDLGGLTSVGGDFDIIDCDNLTNLYGFDELVTIGGTLKINLNAVLSSFNISDLLDLNGLVITNNPMLDYCALNSICNYLGCGNTATISNNSSTAGCNSIAEIQSNCIASMSCCPSGDVILSNQMEVDDFIINYPNCTYIQGSVTVEENGTPAITNLNGLANLEWIVGELTIQGNPSLLNLSGLNNLHTAYQINLYSNDNMTSYSGAIQLNYVQIFNIDQPSTAVTDLDEFPLLETIGELNISSSMLTSLDGLENVTTIGGLILIDNTALTDISVLENVNISIIEIMDNTSLSNCAIYSICNLLNCGGSSQISNNGANCSSESEILSVCTSSSCCPYELNFSSQAEIIAYSQPNCPYIPGNVFISGSDILDLSPLSSITGIGGNLQLADNLILTSLDGLSGLQTVGGYVYIGNNTQLTDIGLDNLQTIGGYLEISFNNALVGISGLGNLSTVDEMYVTSNPELVNLNILPNLTTIQNSISVHDNGKMTSLTGLEAVTTFGGTVNIFGNPMLSDCAVSSICNHLDNQGSIFVSTNLTGCNSQIEVENACCMHPDYAALEAFYTSTNGVSWNNNTGWLQDCDPCGAISGTPWFGIDCTNNNNRVRNIFLPNNNLTGTLPPEISGLEFLNWVNFDLNNIGGTIPTEICQLTNLGHLILSRNPNLTGSIPNCFDNNGGLVQMVLHSCNLTGTLPDFGVNNNNLIIIELRDNSLTGTIPSSWGNIPSLNNGFLIQNNNLSGDYDPLLQNLCPLTMTNAFVSDGNNFNEPWEDFCACNPCTGPETTTGLHSGLCGSEVEFQDNIAPFDGYSNPTLGGTVDGYRFTFVSLTDASCEQVIWDMVNSPTTLPKFSELNNYNINHDYEVTVETRAIGTQNWTCYGQACTISFETDYPLHISQCENFEMDINHVFYSELGLQPTANNFNTFRAKFYDASDNLLESYDWIPGTTHPKFNDVLDNVNFDFGINETYFVRFTVEDANGNWAPEGNITCEFGFKNNETLHVSQCDNAFLSLTDKILENRVFTSSDLDDFAAYKFYFTDLFDVLIDSSFVKTAAELAFGVAPLYSDVPGLVDGQAYKVRIRVQDLQGTWSNDFGPVCGIGFNCTSLTNNNGTVTADCPCNNNVEICNGLDDDCDGMIDEGITGAIIYVNQSASGSNNGTSWTDAYTDFQSAVDFISNNTNCSPIEVWVASGVYYPSEDSQGNTGGSNLNKGFFINTDCKIIGGFPNTGNPTMVDRDWVLHPTIFSGDIDGDDDSNNADGNFIAESHIEISGSNSKLLELRGTEDINSEIDGLIFTGGTQSGIHCQPYSSIANPSSYPKIKNCVFQGNTSIYGGGVYSNVYTDDQTLAESIYSNPEIDNCKFINNYADYGGAVYVRSHNGQNYVIDSPTSAPKINNSIFIGNESNEGGAIYVRAWSKDHVTHCLPEVTNSLFANNSAVNKGGAIYAYAFNRNTNSNCRPKIINSTFYNNSTQGQGGAIYSFGDSQFAGVASVPTIINSIFWQNSAVTGDEIYNEAVIKPGWGWFQADNGVKIEYSLVESADCNVLNVGNNTTISCNNNMFFGVDPLFVDAPNLDFSLQQCSPAINTGTNTNAPVNDLLGNARPYVGAVSVADMGAYEYQGDPLPSVAYYPDVDLDTYGDMNAVAEYICQGETPPTGKVANKLDCDDGDNTIYTGATELCNGIDEDCDGDIDEALVVPFTFNYNFQCLQNGDNVTVNWSGGCPGWKVRVTLDHIQNNIIVSSKNNISNTGSTSWTIPSHLVPGTYKFYIDYWYNGSAVTWTHGPHFFIGDSDGDGFCDLEDNCPDDPNPNQEDLNSNGIGDACETCPLGGIIYVNQSASGANDGTSWTDAFTNLQSALDLVDNGSCSSGTEVRVAAGTYLPTKEKNIGDPRSKTFYFDTDIEIYGGYDPAGTGTRDLNLYHTILSGDLDGGDVQTGTIPEVCISIVGNGNAYHVVYIENVSSAFELDGFVIVSGKVGFNSAGGGIFIYGSSSGSICSPNIRNCFLSGNHSSYSGGGIYNSAFDGNTATTLENVIFYCNSADDNGGGLVDAAWSGPSFGANNTTILNCSFKKNTSSYGAGYVTSGNNLSSITNTSFIGNNASIRGGGVYNFTIDGINQSNYTNCVFSGNKAGNNGSAVFNIQNPTGNCSPTFSFCTFSGNNAGSNGIGGAIYNNNSTPTIQNSILWGNSNSTQIIDNGTASTTKLHNIIQNDFPLDPTTKDLDPLFISMPDYNNAPTTNGDLRLQACSPAVDGGNAQTSPAEDIAGSIRPTYGAHDWGAYEFVAAPCGTIRFYVDKDATGNNDGTSWTDAYTDLQSAIESAKQQITTTDIWVAEGVYYPSKIPNGNTSPIEDRTFYIDKEMNLFGGFAGTETDINQRNLNANPTILSGDVDGNDTYSNGNEPNIIQNPANDIQGNNSYHILTVHLSDSESPIIDGFTFTAGNGNGPSFPRNFAGGIMIRPIDNLPNKSVEIINCQFVGNFARVGAGLAVYTRVKEELKLKVTNSIFFHNYASSSGGGYYSYHDAGYSGMKLSQTFINCKFISNISGNKGGAITIRNFSPSQGHSKIDLVNCLLTNNSAKYGGALYIRNTVKSRSRIYPTIINSTFANNNAEYGGVLFHTQDNHLVKLNPIISNSVFWANHGTKRGDLFDGKYHQSTINNSLLQTTTCNLASTGNNNSITCNSTILNQDPLFVDMDGADNILGTLDDDYRIATNSPGVDAGDIGYLPADEYDLDGDGDVAENIPYDLIGAVREFGTNVDMGAMEYDGNYIISTPPSSSNLTEDKPNTSDLQDHNNVPPPYYGSGNILENAMYSGIIYVDKDAAGSNNGMSWTDAFNNLQDGITAALSGNQIWVAEGVYYPTQDTSGSFTPLEDFAKTFYITEDIQIYGGFNGTEGMLSLRNPTSNITILSGDVDMDDENTDGDFIAETTGDINGFNAAHVVYFDAVGSNCLMDGFTITAGEAKLIPYGSFAEYHDNGGGILVYGSGGNSCSPQIMNCKFYGNYAENSGGAIFNYGYLGGTASPTVEDCYFEGNEAQVGGGIANEGHVNSLVSPTLLNNQFISNTALDGGAFSTYGITQVQMDSCQFESNFAADNGGAMFISGSDSSAYSAEGTYGYSTFKANEAGNDGGAIFATGVELGSVTTIFVNNLFSGNYAENYGGSVYNDGQDGVCEPKFFNCTFTGSYATRGGGAMTNHYAFPKLYNNILWGNNSEILDGASIPVAENNLILNGYLLDANVKSADPEFVLQPDFNNAPTTAGNFHLGANSDAIDAGLNSAIDTLGLTVDLAANNRLYDGNGNSTPTVDIGAYEFLGAKDYYPDVDGDTFGDVNTNPLSVPNTMDSPANYVLDNTDCDDSNNTIHPNATEVCDNVDNNCNTLVDMSDPNIVDTTKPTPIVINSPVQVVLPPNTEATVYAVDFDAASYDNCGIASMSISQSTFNCGDIGMNSIDFTVTDVNGLSESITIMLEIIDPQSNCNCDDENVNLTNSSPADPLVMADEEITSEATVAINTTVIYQGGTGITLTPNFVAEEGSDFTARIADCDPSSLVDDEPAIPNNAFSSSPQSSKMLSMNISPNPFNKNALIEFELPKVGAATLVVYTMAGKRIKILLDKVQMVEGFHQIELNGTELPMGMMYFQLELEGETVVKKMVRVN